MSDSLFSQVEKYVAESRDLSDKVEEFRHSYEPKLHWEARREFILKNYEDFPDNQDRVVSLSMVWSNMQFDHTTYHPHLMERVNELARGITIRKAGDELVEEAAAGKSSTRQAKKRPKEQAADACDGPSPVKFTRTIKAESKVEPPKLPQPTRSTAELLEAFTAVSKSLKNFPAGNDPVSIFYNVLGKKGLNPDFIFSQPTAAASRNADAMLKPSTTFPWQCDLYVEGVFVSTATASNKASIKKVCSDKAMKTLMKPHLTIATSSQTTGTGLGQSRVELVGQEDLADADAAIAADHQAAAAAADAGERRSPSDTAAKSI